MLINRFSIFTKLICSKRGINKEIPLQNIVSLLHTNIIYILICIFGIIFSPAYIKTALGIGLPFLILGYLVTKMINYKLGGIISITATYLINALIIFEFDKMGNFSYLPFCWMTITTFVAIIFLDIKQVILLSILPSGFALFLTLLSEHIATFRILPWLFFNLFFTVICVSTKEILLNYRNQLIIQNNNLEQIVLERTEELSDALEEKDILIKELYHRTKNNMQVISSLLHLQMESTENQKVQVILSKTFSRINAMSLVHEKLYSSHNLRFISFKEYLIDLSAEILNAGSNKPVNINFFHDSKDIAIPLEAAVPLGLVVNELLSNISKQSSFSPNQLILTIRWSFNSDRNLRIFIHHNNQASTLGDSFCDVASLSLTLVKNLIEGQLNGTIEFTSESIGSLFKIKIPIMMYEKQETFCTHALSV